MASVYPAALDNFTLIHTDAELMGPDVIDVEDAVNKIEAELGTDPSGTLASVKARLEALDGYAVVASADVIAIPAGAAVVGITGTTDITSITAAAAGRRVTLIFSESLTLSNGSNLRLATDLVTSINDAIILVSDGTNWIETDPRYGDFLATLNAKAESSLLAASAKGQMAHAADAGASRPGGFASVEWQGSVEPTNAVNGDTWIDTA